MSARDKAEYGAVARRSLIKAVMATVQVLRVMLAPHKVEQKLLGPIRMPSGHQPWRNVAQGTVLKQWRASCESKGHSPATFLLRPEGYHSSSELRSLSTLEETDECYNYRSDPDQV